MYVECIYKKGGALWYSKQMECLEDYCYILREKCVPAESLERQTVRFLGRTIGEFKN